MSGAGVYGGIASGAGQMFAGIFSSFGDKAEADAYGAAARNARQNAAYTALSTGIQERQTQRAIYQNIGTQKATTAASGFTGGGSAMDVVKSTVQQGGLQKSIVSMQGMIQENAYNEQAVAYDAQKQALNYAATGALIGGFASGLGTMLSGGG